MKFTSAALLLVLSSDNVSAFTPSFVPRNLGSSSFVMQKSFASPPKQQLQQQRNSGMVMFAETSGGMEQLQELTEAADTTVLSKQVRKSPSLFKLAGMATVPISAAIGFGLVPSRRFAAHTVGAVVTGIAGAVGKSRLDALTEANAKPALAQAVIDNGLDDVEQTAAAVNSVQEQFGLLDEDFEVLCMEIYSTYLMGMVKFNPTPKTSELKELESLKTALSLDNLQVGEAHCAAATEWYRTTCLFTPEEELEDADHPDRRAMDKLIFLTERALKQGGETDEAFRFEMTRVAKALKLDLATALDRVAETAEPFYTKALKSARSKLGTGQVNSAMLERARRTLGISDDTAFDMHIAAFNEEVRSLLGLVSGTNGDSDEENNAAPNLSAVKFSEDDVDRVSAAACRLQYASHELFHIEHDVLHCHLSFSTFGAA